MILRALMPHFFRLPRMKLRQLTRNNVRCLSWRTRVWKMVVPVILIDIKRVNRVAAGIRMEDFVGSKTSCYVGNFTRDYGELFDRDIDYRPKYAATGCGRAMASNRISWFFNLKGPSLTLDSACSSSLVGVHLACQSLRSGESKMVSLACGQRLEKIRPNYP